MPTTLRPSILNRTLKTFTKNLFLDKSRFRFIFNIDPVGENCLPEDIVDIASTYFDNILYNIAETPSFPKAFIWCWQQASSDYLFHMNEDWELVRPLDIDVMIDLLEKNKNLACLRLNKMAIPSGPVIHIFNCDYISKGDYLLAGRRDDQFGTNPELIRGSFYKKARKYLVDNKNPEKQFRSWHEQMFKNVVTKWDYAVYARPGDKVLIRDIGKNWMKKNNFRKKGGPGFTLWEKK
jgi:hypothetical protein